jgi:hypothetical protein
MPAEAPALDDVALLAAFEQGTLPAECFSHREHVRVAWLYLRREAPGLAMERFVADLQRLARGYGKPGLYHATITWAYLLLIRERIERTPGLDFGGFAAAYPELLARTPSLLARYYRDETLASELARRVFVMPDRLAAAA